MSDTIDNDNLLREIEAVKDTEAELEGLVPVKAKVESAGAGIVFSVRLTAEEFTAISTKARELGMKTGTLVRLAALAASQGDLEVESGRRSAALARLRSQAHALAKALDGLT